MSLLYNRRVRNYSKYIAKHKILYNKIGAIPCQALGDELVHFNSHGFKHLIRKNGVLRPRREQAARLALLRFCKSLIFEKGSLVRFTENYTNSKHTQFWCLIGTIESKKIKIVIRKTGEGKTHFFSVFESK